jgi:glucuronide carrier protein
MGQALGGAAGAYALSFVAFNSAAAKAGEAQTADAINGVQVGTGLLTAGFILFSLLIMWFYPLTDKRFREIVAEISARRAQREAVNS